MCLILFQNPILKLLNTQGQVHNNPLFANVLSAIHNIVGINSQHINPELKAEYTGQLPLKINSEASSLKTKSLKNKKGTPLKDNAEKDKTNIKKKNTITSLTQRKKTDASKNIKDKAIIKTAKIIKKEKAIEKIKPANKPEMESTPPATSKVAVRYFNSLKKEDKAVWLLLSNWGIELNHARIDASGKPIPLINQVSRFNFAIFSTWADIDLLIKINIPCAVEVIKDGKSMFYVLNAIKNDLVRLYTAPDQMKVIPIKEFLSIWQGNSYIITEKGDNTLEGKIAVYRGNEGDEVIKLVNILNKLNYSSKGISDTYDLKLEEIVKQFQKNNGLTSDGIVGVETKLLFYSKLSKHIPRLIITSNKR